MDASLSLPDPGEFHHPLQNGHAPGLVIDDLEPFAPVLEDPATEGSGDLDEADLPGDRGIPPFDLADVLAAPGFTLTPEVVDEQARLLDDEFRAELDLLPGFEALTRTDLHRARNGLGNQVTCPDWCSYAGLPVHGDGFDTTPEADVPHRGVPHDIPLEHGGQNLDHAGRADVSVQLEQDRDQSTGPVITLSVVVRGVEQCAWLTTAEATALRRTLDQLLDAASDHA